MNCCKTIKTKESKKICLVLRRTFKKMLWNSLQIDFWFFTSSSINAVYCFICQQFEAIDKSLLIITVFRWAKIYLHMQWIKWTPNHLCEIRDIHFNSAEVYLFQLFSLLLSWRQILASYTFFFSVFLFLLTNITIKRCFAPMRGSYSTLS